MIYMKFAKIVLFILCIIFVLLSCVLFSKLTHSNNEKSYFNKKVEELTVQEKQLCDKFRLKQDYMRKMISDNNFIEQMVREKTGLSKPNEVIFKFDN